MLWIDAVVADTINIEDHLVDFHGFGMTQARLFISRYNKKFGVLHGW